MLDLLHKAIIACDWDKAALLSPKCDLQAKGESGKDAIELAASQINKWVEVKYRHIPISIHQTPLSAVIFQEAGHGEKGSIDRILGLIALGADVNNKNKAGNNSLMDYLWSVKGIQNGSETNWPSLKIIDLLISKGAAFLPNEKNKNPLCYAEKHFGESLKDYMEKKAKMLQDKEYYSAITIQRAWRGMAWKKKGLEERKNISAASLHRMLSDSPQTPKADNSMDLALARKWINMHDPEDRPLAEKVLQKIDHVSHERFLFGLRLAIKKWNNLIMSRPLSERKYVILLDPRPQKSIPWVTSFAIPYLAYPPAQVLTLDELPSIQADINHIVIFDDATYSGNQMSRCLNSLFQVRILPEHQHFLNAETHIVIPFISEVGKKVLEGMNANVIYHETMPNFELDDVSINGVTATYFQHKIAQEGISTISLISTGETLRGKPGIRFIPSTKEPYKSIS